MSRFSRARSQFANLQFFPRFFPVRRTLKDLLGLPLDLARGSGRSTRFPHVINVNLTTACNLDCGHCFNAGIDAATGPALTLADFVVLADEWSPHRPGVFFSGGEPFVREDALDILSAFKRRGMPVGVVTNGTLLDEEKIRDLAALDLDAFIVSFHGHGSTHDRAVGRKGAFARSMNALRLWSRHGGGVKPVASFVLTQESASDLPTFVRDIERSADLSLRLSHLNFLTPEEVERQDEAWEQRFDGQPCELLAFVHDPPDGAFEPLYSFLESAEGRGVVTKPVLSAKETRDWYAPGFRLDRRCLFIWRSTYVNTDGCVYPCQNYLTDFGNVRNQSMETIWNSPRYCSFRASVARELMPGCTRCCKL